MESWYAGPKLNFFYSNDESNSNSPGNLGKFSSGKNAFALDFAAGAKMYVGKNYGFRADFTNVMSFGDFTTTSVTNGHGADNFPTDVGLFPVSARLTQSGRFNQAIFSGGVFWDLGGRATTNGYTAPSGDRDSMNDRWEFGINFGGAHGAPWGTESATCAETTPAGCDFTSTSLTHNAGGPYPGHLVKGQLPETLVEGGLKPGDGWMTGFQIGYNWTPNWQIAFIYNILGTGTRFDNHAALENGLVAFFSGCDCEGTSAVELSSLTIEATEERKASSTSSWLTKPQFPRQQQDRSLRGRRIGWRDSALIRRSGYCRIPCQALGSWAMNPCS